MEFIGKYLWQSFFLIKLQADVCNFTKKRLWHRCFPVNFGKSLRTPFLRNISGWLLLMIGHYWQQSLKVTQSLKISICGSRSFLLHIFARGNHVYFRSVKLYKWFSSKLFYCPWKGFSNVIIFNWYFLTFCVKFIIWARHVRNTEWKCENIFDPV